ncbi:hypothetical protein ACRARG_04620 [Pseudooceanicola sp. C21-150M6]|uniref:hypothetical protein n=1 Tax=Pseudooceanicola sp. C21-150M6 TaxID=3434355 RepID=UPI003D7FCF93
MTRPRNPAERLILDAMKPGREYTLDDMMTRMKGHGKFQPEALKTVLDGMAKSRLLQRDMVKDGKKDLPTWRVI